MLHEHGHHGVSPKAASPAFQNGAVLSPRHPCCGCPRVRHRTAPRAPHQHHRRCERVHIGDGLPDSLLPKDASHAVRPPPDYHHTGHATNYSTGSPLEPCGLHRVPHDLGGGGVLHEDAQRWGPHFARNGPRQHGLWPPGWYGRQRYDRPLDCELPQRRDRAPRPNCGSLRHHGLRHGRVPSPQLYPCGCSSRHHDRGGAPHLQVVLSYHGLCCPATEMPP
mmetsp:Transcript_63235/g.135866  ORF Transcript_63235/g.135866 Transcript_63235/m.135866 type:complete len:221 (-) Transcript_63235:619-1281(-)